MTDRNASTALPLDARSYAQASACIHCGLCLPACPTYTETGLEAESPRGRLHLMKAMADGRIDATDNVVEHLDQCLNCRACETACPSGVVYHEVIEQTRTLLADDRPADERRALLRWVCSNVLVHPRRLKLALLPVRLLQRARVWPIVRRALAHVLPDGLARMQSMLADDGPIWPSAPAAHHPPRGERRMTVGLHTGCVASVMQAPVNQMAIELLQHLGCEVVVPRGQRCCGAIHHHGGGAATAARFAQRNIEAFADCDRIVTITAGCGAMLKEYRDLLHGDDEWSPRAAALAAKTRDVTELIDELLSARDWPPRHRVECTATYHAACHLRHAQRIAEAPLRLLRRIDGLTLVPLTEHDRCCGAAGTYNLEQPDMARRLAERKLSHIAATGADRCVVGNVGCAMQLAGEARRLGRPLTIVHPVELLHEAYVGRGPA